MRQTTRRWTALVLLTIASAACAKPSAGSLRDSFAQQLAANKAIANFQRSSDDLTFTGPTLAGGTAQWRVHIDSAVIEDTGDERAPYKGTVKSSWYQDGKLVEPHGRESNLPNPLITTGLAQDCWALWDPTAKKWGWE